MSGSTLAFANVFSPAVTAGNAVMTGVFVFTALLFNAEIDSSALLTTLWLVEIGSLFGRSFGLFLLGTCVGFWSKPKRSNSSAIASLSLPGSSGSSSIVFCAGGNTALNASVLTLA